MAPIFSTQKSNRIPYLDGLRGLGAFLVVTGHMWMLAGWPPFLIPLKVGPLDHLDLLFFLAIGDVRVSLFLVLSGFFLFLPFAKSESRGASMTLVEFARRRARRILPAYYAAIALSLAVPVAAYYASACVKFFRGAPIEPMTWQPLPSIISHLLIAQGLSPQWFTSLNGPMWTLTVEVELYIIFPVLAWLSEKYGIVKIVFLSIVLNLLYRSLAHQTFGTLLVNPIEEFDINYYNITRHVFIGRLSEFVLGMLAAKFVINNSAPLILRNFILLVASICFSFFVTNRYGLYYGISDLLWGFSFFLLIINCSTSKRVGKVFSNRLLSWMGRISYSLYLIHFPLIYIYLRAMKHTGFFVGQTAFLLMLTGWPLLLFISYHFYNLFEKPFLNSQIQTTKI